MTRGVEQKPEMQRFQQGYYVEMESPDGNERKTVYLDIEVPRDLLTGDGLIEDLQQYRLKGEERDETIEAIAPDNALWEVVGAGIVPGLLSESAA